MTICKTNQDRPSIYKCRNLRSNLDCNLFSHIIEIAPTVSLTDAAARGKRQRSHAAAISLREHILWIKNSIAHIQATSAFSIHLSGATDRAVKPRLRAQESNSGSTSRSSAAHNKKKKIPWALCHQRSWSDKLSSGRRLVRVKVTLPVLILQVCTRCSVNH